MEFPKHNHNHKKTDRANTIQSLEEENRQLRLSRAHYRSMFAHSKVAIWEEDFTEVMAALDQLKISSSEELDAYLTSDPNRVFDIISRAKVHNVNPATVSMFGADSKEELMGSIKKVLTPHTLPFLHSELLALWKGERFFEGETINRTLDDRLIHLLVTISIIDEGETSGHVLVSMMDITDRIQREQHQAKLLDEIQQRQLYAEIMQEITIALTSRIKRDPLLDTILEQVQRLVEYSSGNFRLLQGDTAYIVRSRGYEERGIHEFISSLNMPIDDFPLQREAIQTRRPVVIQNTKTDPRWFTYPETSYIHSFLLLPIFTQDKVYGLLSIEHQEPGAYSRETAEKLLPFAHAAAIAFARSELYEQLNAELEAKQRAQEELAASNQQKDTLLQEIHHRIKNNLSLISSLINLQSYRTEEPAIQEMLEQLRGKILSILMVHEKLYRSTDFQNVSLHEYIRDLLHTLESTAGTTEVHTHVDIGEHVVLSTNTLIPVGLILTELFTNSSKYAQPPEGEPIRFSVHGLQEAGTVSLQVQDNGPGLPGHRKEDQIYAEEGLGLTLVENLVEQIGGTLELKEPPGFHIMLEFPA
ncbi:MAG TPA: histidine kinase dimerization/phosphoacceptor domain -containing protein [Clostridia bacterium]|nr:histidine kinase dimerization/phosphoacceptor domain -containing protein [Clostridia bacterium]